MSRSIVSLSKDLSSLISGAVLDAGDIGYQEAIALDNGGVSHEPLLIVQPDCTDDISKVVSYCAKNGVRLTTKSGGHSANGYSLNSEGIVIDLARMNDIQFTSAGLEFEAGTRWIEAYDFIREMRDPRIVIGGGCPGVGVAGFLLGGGYSFLSRSYGMGSDSILSVEIVTLDGQIVHLDETTTNKDESSLFWGLRGGGGGNFGVVTKFGVSLHDVHTPLMVGQIVFPFYRIDEILSVYDEWSLTLPNSMAVYGMLRNYPDPRNAGRPMLGLRFTPIFNGDYAEGIRLLQPLLELGPIASEFYSMTLPEWENFIGSATLVSGNSAYIRSIAMEPHKLSAAVPVFKEYMGRAPSADTFIVWTHAGGEIANFNGAHSAFPHRNAQVVVEVKSIWDSSRPELKRTNVEWAYNFFNDLERFGCGSYLNYIDPLLTNWESKFYGKSYKRLLEIKKKWDPSGLFDFQQGIGSTYKAPQPERNGYLDLSPLYRTFEP